MTLADAFGSAANMGPAPKARGGSAAAQQFNAAHPRAAKGRTGGGRFVDKSKTTAPQSTDGVKHIERNLKGLGFSPDAKGVSDFQKSRGLPVTGRIDGDTERAMRNAVYAASADAQAKAAAGAKRASVTPMKTAVLDANKVVQGNLQQAGFNVSPSGTWSARDDEALAAFQQEHKIKPKPATVGTDGAVSVDPETAAALSRFGWKPAGQNAHGGASGDPSARSSASGSAGASASGDGAAGSQRSADVYAEMGDGIGRDASPDQRVFNVQEKLDSLGYELSDAGVDGRFGPATKGAIEKFQRDHGIDPSGKVDEDTLYLLTKLAAERQAKRPKGEMDLSADEPAGSYSRGGKQSDDARRAEAKRRAEAERRRKAAEADRKAQEALLADAVESAVVTHVFGIAEGVAAWAEALHPRGRGGKFRAKPGGDFTKAMDTADARVERTTARGMRRDSAAPAQRGRAQQGDRPEAAPKSPLVAGEAERHFNDAGHVSQRTLLKYVAEATQGERTIEQYARREEDGSITWDESRRALHGSIIDAFMRRRKKGEHGWELDPEGEPLKGSKEPMVLFSGGGYAAGKSSVLRKLPPERMPPGVDGGLVLDPDLIKAQLPEFQQGLKDGDPEANLRVYEEAWAIAQEIQARAQEQRLNLIVDGISNTSSEEMMARLKSFTGKGYKAHVVYVDIPTDEAVRRAQSRARGAKTLGDRRYIPETILRSVHRDVAATVPRLLDRLEVEALDGVSVEVWDNSAADNMPRRMASLDAGSSLSIDDGALWRRFQEKAHETIPGVDAK